MKSIKAIVRGKVQGVWYRDSTRTQATTLNIVGHAINLPDGTVEVIAQGSETHINQLISWLSQGPPKAVVTGVTVEQIALIQKDDFTTG